MTENPYQKYVFLLYGTQQAHQACDDFDLRSEDAASMETWTTLRAEQRAADVELLSHVQTYATVILEILARDHAA